MVTLTLDKERHLKLTLKGMVEFEAATGKNLLEGLQLTKLSPRDFGALVWACLIWEDRKLQLDDVLCLIEPRNLVKATEALTACLTESFPVPVASKGESSPLLAEAPGG